MLVAYVAPHGIYCANSLKFLSFTEPLWGEKMDSV